MQPLLYLPVALTLRITVTAFTLTNMLYFLSSCLESMIGGIFMSKQHISSDDRYTISTMLANKQSFKSIATAIGKNCTTVSREIRNHLQFRKTGGFGHPFNACVHRRNCSHFLVCTKCSFSKSKRCSLCEKCNDNCPDFLEEKCKKLTKPPYVCNGCDDRRTCTLEKRYYNAAYADKEYRTTLSEARSGISYSEAEIQHLDEVISPLIFRGQSINHICANNKDSLMVSESTIYRLVDYNLFKARNIDLPRKVKYSKRKCKKNYKIDKACRIGRTFENFQSFREEHPDIPIVQMDSVEGSKGGKVLLTLHFVKAELMIAFLRDANDSQSVIAIFERLYLQLRPDIFRSLFQCVLTDNGSEFSNPKAIEQDPQGNPRTKIFYCDASAPGQKGSAEKNHEFIRYVLPKGTSFNELSQDDISLLMDHINSYSRESLGNKCPYEVFEFLYGTDILNTLGCHRIAPNDVNLTPKLLK